MVSTLSRPTDGAHDDGFRPERASVASARIVLPQPREAQAAVRPAVNGSRFGSAAPSQNGRSTAAPESLGAGDAAATPTAPGAAWRCLVRAPGTPWREKVPTGPAMPARWALHQAAEFKAEVEPELFPTPVETPAGSMPADFSFGDLALTEPIRRAVWEAGYRTPTPIQLATVPLLLGGKDVVGQAQTGTGKTAAFGLPVLERMDPAKREVQAIILLPTRELCRQVANELTKLGKHRGVDVLAVYGGEGMQRQLDALSRGVQVVVGTPGRVQDHIWRGTLRLDAVRFAVLDEADEMLDVGFAEDIERILRCVPTERQTALFSATIPPFVHTLVRRYLREPEWISTVDHSQPAAARIPTTIRQSYIQVAERDKLEALEELSKEEPGYNRVLVFRRMKVHADRLAEAMRRKGFSVRAMHGDLPQGERNRVLEDFKAGRLQFLVATNVAARGLDIPEVSHVLNYDLPDTPEEYVHRIGRTGRAGREGTSISFVAEWDFQAFEAIKKHVGDALQERHLRIYGER